MWTAWCWRSAPWTGTIARWRRGRGSLQRPPACCPIAAWWTSARTPSRRLPYPRQQLACLPSQRRKSRQPGSHNKHRDVLRRAWTCRCWHRSANSDVSRKKASSQPPRMTRRCRLATKCSVSYLNASNRSRLRRRRSDVDGSRTPQLTKKESNVSRRIFVGAARTRKCCVAFTMRGL